MSSKLLQFFDTLTFAIIRPLSTQVTTADQTEATEATGPAGGLAGLVGTAGPEGPAKPALIAIVNETGTCQSAKLTVRLAKVSVRRNTEVSVPECQHVDADSATT